MNFFFDENVPPILTEAIKTLAQHEIANGSYNIHHVRQTFGAGTPDVSWLKKSASYNKPIIITADRKILTRPHEKAALSGNGLTCFIIPKTATKKKFWDKSSWLIRWWTTIVETSKYSLTGQIYVIPDTYSVKTLTPKK